LPWLSSACCWRLLSPCPLSQWPQLPQQLLPPVPQQHEQLLLPQLVPPLAQVLALALAMLLALATSLALLRAPLQVPLQMPWLAPPSALMMLVSGTAAVMPEKPGRLGLHSLLRVVSALLPGLVLAVLASSRVGSQPMPAIEAPQA